MKPVAIALICLSFTWAYGQKPPSSRDAETLKRVLASGEMVATDIDPIIRVLGSNNKGDVLSALRFWATQIDLAYTAQSEDYDTRNPQTWVTFDQSLVEAIDNCCSSSSREIRHEAIRTLCALSYLCGRCATGYDTSRGYLALSALEKRAKAARDDLLDLVNDPDPHVVDFAFREMPTPDLGRLQPQIRAMLHHPDDKFRIVAVTWFKPLSKRDAFESFADLLVGADDDLKLAIQRALKPFVDPQKELANGDDLPPTLKRAFIDMMGWQKSPEIVRLARHFLGDASGEVRAGALSKLESFKEPVDTGFLRNSFDKGVPEERLYAFYRLCEQEPEDAVDLIIRACGDTDSHIRAAGFSLGCRRENAHLEPVLLKAVEQGVSDDWEACSLFDVPGNEHYLQEAVDSKNVNLRAIAALTLEVECSESRLPMLLKLSESSENEVLRFVIPGLATRHDARAMLALERIILRSKGNQLIEAIDHLGRSKQPAAEDFLATYLTSESPRVRHAASKAIATLRESSPPPSLIGMRKW